LENYQIKIVNNVIPLKIHNVNFYKSFGFDKIIIELEDGVITVSSIIEDFELFKELIQKRWEENQLG